MRTVSRSTLVGIFPIKWENARQNSNLVFDGCVKGSAPKVPILQIVGLLLLHQMVRRGAPRIVKNKFASEVATLKKCFLGVSKFKLRTYTF